MAGFAFEFHLADTPGETHAHKARVELAAAGGLVGGGGGVLSPFGHAEDVVDVEEDGKLALEEVGRAAEVDALVGHREAVETQAGRGVVGVGEDLELVPQFGPEIDAGAPADLTVAEAIVVVGVVEQGGVEADVEEAAGAVGDVGLEAFGVAGADVLGLTVVHQLRGGEVGGSVAGVGHGADLVGVGAEVGAEVEHTEAHDVLAPGGLEIVGVAAQQVGVADLVAVVLIAHKGRELGSAGIGVAEGVAEAVGGEGGGLVAEVDTGHEAEEGGVDDGLAGAVEVAPFAVLPGLLAAEAQFGGEAAPAFLEGEVAAEACAALHAFGGAQGDSLVVAVGGEGVEPLKLRAAAQIELHAGLYLELVFEGVGVIQLHAAAGADVALLGAAEEAVDGRVGVGESLGADAVIVPGVAAEGEGELSTGGVETVLEPGAHVAAPAEAVGILELVVVPQVAQRGQILAVDEVELGGVVAPVGVDAKPGGEVGLVGDIPVEVETAVAAVALGVGLAGGALVAAGVAVGVEEGAGAVGIHVVDADVGVEVEIDVELLVGVDVGSPGRETRHGVGAEAQAEELVARDLLAGDDVDDAAGGAVACGGIGDDLDALDGVGGHLLDILFEGLLVHVGGAVVDPDLDAGNAAQGDVALGVHLHTGGVLEGVAGGPRLDGGILLGIVHILLAVHLVERLLGHDFHLLEECAALELDHDVVDIGGNVDHLHVALVADAGSLHQVLAGLDVLDLEEAVEVARGAAHEDGVRAPHEAHVHQGQCLAGFGVLDGAFHLYCLCLRSRHHSHQGKHSKNQFFHCCLYYYIITYYLYGRQSTHLSATTNLR